MSETRIGTAYDIVVYGATMPGVAAARTAATLHDGPLLVVNPQPGFGGIGGVGCQNFWDERPWNVGGDAIHPQGGSFKRWYDAFGQAYDPRALQGTLSDELDAHDTIDIATDWDLVDVDRHPSGIEHVTIRPLANTGSDAEISVTADVFIDASESGRLTQLSGVSHTIGREDWGQDDRQMAATLMVPVENLDWEVLRTTTTPDGERVFSTHVDPTSEKRLFWGGEHTITTAPEISAFAENHPRFSFKAMNAAEGAAGEFWLNTLLIYDVDGRSRGRERPNVAPSDTWKHDEALTAARRVVESSGFRNAIRTFPGFDAASLVRGQNGEVLTAETLYVRETIHTQDPDRGFAVDRECVEHAGTSRDDGSDADKFDRRIGLAYYWLDNNGYEKQPPGNQTELEDAENPVYLPYDALTTKTCPNLLLPGYPVRVSSQAWFELRVLPNLCVLGDAAGVAAAVSIRRGVEPLQFGDKEVPLVQDHLREEFGARLDKSEIRNATTTGKQ